MKSNAWFATIFALLFSTLLFWQVGSVSALSSQNPITSPITSPITPTPIPTITPQPKVYKLTGYVNIVQNFWVRWGDSPYYFYSFDYNPTNDQVLITNINTNQVYYVAVNSSLHLYSVSLPEGTYSIQLLDSGVVTPEVQYITLDKDSMATQVTATTTTYLQK